MAIAANEEQKRPTCVGFIMDGNRRWAKAQGKPPTAGHLAGEQVFYESIGWLQALAIAHGVYYAFSTENWQRSEEEIAYLQELFVSFLKRTIPEIKAKGIRIRIIGNRTDFSPELQKLIATAEAEGAPTASPTVWVALSYGGRAEILAAVNQAVRAGVDVDEVAFTKLLWSNEMPDPDLIIRTGGEQRLSNFLTWQSVYSELYFTDTYWPDFTEEEFRRILDWYATRERRRGR